MFYLITKMKVDTIFSKMNILLLLLISNVVFSKDKKSFLKRTPKADDLGDHFGTEPVDNFYGPINPIQKIPLMREGVTPWTNIITPISNFNEEINPAEVVNGQLTNTSYDASRIIRPPIAVPKAHIKTEFKHDAVVTTPVHVGTQHQEREVRTMNRVTGEVSHKIVSEDKPIVGMLKNVQPVITKRETLVNIDNGMLINLNKATSYHGTV